MPTVEDYFDDDTDLPLPSSSRAHLSGSGLQGALVEEITDDNDIDNQLDYEKLAEQSRGVFGEDAIAPPPSSGKGKLAVRGDDELRPAGQQGPRINPNSPMGGFMGDMMRLQAAEDERLEKLRKQFGSATVATDPSVYKGWNTVYPIYFDAKVSINEGRRVPRASSLWWPQATQIAQACKALGLPSVLEPDRVHPSDWENPGRVKVQFEKDGRFLNPIVKNRAQLYKHLADQLRQRYAAIAFTPSTAPSKRVAKAATSASAGASAKKSKAQSKGKKESKSKKAFSATKQRTAIRLATRPPQPPQPIPTLEARLPLHSPAVATGVALASIKRDKEAEKENKKKGITGGNEEGGKEKMPKMKRVVVRGKR